MAVKEFRTMRSSPDMAMLQKSKAAILALTLLNTATGCATQAPEFSIQGSTLEPYATENLATPPLSEPPLAPDADTEDASSPLRMVRKTGSGQFLNVA